MTNLSIPPGLQTYRTPFADLIARQERAVSTGQLRDLGISPKVITRLARDGWLTHKHQGVWMVGPPPFNAGGAFWAAHLATGAVISHRSAAEFHQMRTSYWKVELTHPRRRRERPSLVLHQGRPRTAHHDGLPVTTVEQTLLDCADVLTPRQLEIAINQADVREKLDHRALESLLLGANGRRGVTPLRHAVEAHALGMTLTESELEERFLQLTRDHGFVQPRTQHHVLGFRCDFAWPEQRIVIETDGARFHRRLRNREQDAQRDRILRRAGWLVDRVSYRQVFFRATEVAVILGESGVPRAASRPRRPRGQSRRPAA